MTEVAFYTASSKAKLDKIRQSLRHQDLSLYEIADLIYLSPRWARCYIDHLREQGLVHITCYREDEMYHDGRNKTRRAIYKWGAGEDAERPDAMTQKERATLARKRMLADPEKHERQLLKRRAERYALMRDPLVAALFGER